MVTSGRGRQKRRGHRLDENTRRGIDADRRKLELAGDPVSWTRLREILSVQQRVTATFRQRDGRTLHVRKATTAEPALRRIYQALGIEVSPGGMQKLTV